MYFDGVAAEDCIHPVCPPLLPPLPDQMEEGRESLLSRSRRPISEAVILQKFAAETELEFKGREVTICETVARVKQFRLWPEFTHGQPWEANAAPDSEPAAALHCCCGGTER